MNIAANPKPTNKSSSCPVCGDTSGKCRTFLDRPLVLCMEADFASGWKDLGSTKDGLWTQFAPDTESNFDRDDWQRRKREEKPVAVPQTMSLDERDRFYRDWLFENSLDERDRADLQLRGVADLSIALSCEFGYAVPFKGLEGQYLGAQWRYADPGDGGRYRWHNLPGGKYYPGTNELPIAVYRPTVEPNGIALVEGTGIKPMLTAERLGMVAIGAAGGLHTASPIQMTAIIEAFPGLPIVIIPDAGDVINPHVMARHKRTVEAFPDAKFLWWSQVSKEQNDVDEASAAEIKSARLLSWQEFSQPIDLPQSSSVLSFHQALDRVELLEQSISDKSELEWAAQNFAIDNGLKSRGFDGKKLLGMSRDRRDGHEQLEILDAHDILESEQNPKFILAGHLLEGTVTVLGAKGGLGKTTLLYDMAKHIATGKAWNGYRVRQGRSLIVQTDEPKPNIKQKLRIANFKDIPRGSIDFITKWRFSKFQQLEELVKKNQYRFVVIDSWTAAHAGLGIDLTRSSAGDNAYLLRDLAEDTGAAIVIVHHLSKAGDLRDSSTLFDNVSDVWKLTKGEERDRLEAGERILSIEKSRSDLMGQYLLEQNAADYSWQHLGPLESPDLRGTEPLIARILQHFTKTEGGTLSAADICKEFGCDFEKATIELERLHRQGAIDCTWVQWRKDGHDRGFWNYIYRSNPDDPQINEQPEPIKNQLETEAEYF